ncbi:respiratory nitrate reductase alpha chain [Cutibacterium acnes JCM 18916]|nr:respiratory nitrate reductase alpha chain [Cutibacterium acnes JCM 18916]
MHDTPDEMTTPAGSVSREQEAWIPGVTMPKLVTVSVITPKSARSSTPSVHSPKASAW